MREWGFLDLIFETNCTPNSISSAVKPEIAFPVFHGGGGGGSKGASGYFHDWLWFAVNRARLEPIPHLLSVCTQRMLHCATTQTV